MNDLICSEPMAGLSMQRRSTRSLRQRLSGLVQLLGCYYRRARQRRALAALDDRMLKDIGISRVDALREARKPFWRP